MLGRGGELGQEQRDDKDSEQCKYSCVNEASENDEVEKFVEKNEN